MNFGVTQGQELSVIEMEKTDTATIDNAGKKLIIEKLNGITIPYVEFENVSLEEATDFLRSRMCELDTTTVNPIEKGLKIVVRYAPGAEAPQAQPRINSLELANKTAAIVLQHICDATGYRYSVDQTSVIIEPITKTNTSAPTKTSTSSELSKSLSPLIRPDIESAKLVLSNLEKLADNKNGADKVAIQAMSSIIKNTYSAEFIVANKIKDQQQAETEARKHDRHAKEWLSPNAFGTINRAAAKDSTMKADTIRKKASADVSDAHKKLIIQLQDADAMIQIYHKRNDYNVVSILATTMLSINERSLPKNAYRPWMTREKIATLNEFIASRTEWLATANHAENSLHYEEAIRFYAKSRDDESKKRCANLLAARFEKSDFPASSIEYYEMAGNHEKALEIQQNNPFMLASQYKALSPEELDAKISPSCVRISDENSQGTGFFIKKGGYILTNRHIVDKKNDLKVKVDDGRSFAAKIIATSPDHDLAIIKIELDEHFIIGLRNQKAYANLPVTLIGFPTGEATTTSMNSGTLAKNDQEVNGHSFHRLDIAATQENSGGPVVDQTGQLVGMFTSGISELEVDKVNFAITVETVAKFVSENLK
jgi:Trypsin-like peptidase domain